MLLAVADSREIIAVLLTHVSTDALLHELRIASDGVQWGAQLVRHGREEPGLRPIGGFRLGEPPRVVDLALLRETALGEITRHLGEPDELPMLAEEGGDDHVRP